GHTNGAAREAIVTIRFRRNWHQSRSITIKNKPSDGDAESVARAILQGIDPYVLALYLIHERDIDGAFTVLTRMTRDPHVSDKEAAQAHAQLGDMVSARGGPPELVIFHYINALERDQNTAPAYAGWGRILRKQGRLDDAA